MISYSLNRMIRLAIAMSAEKDTGALLDLILKEAMDITRCDAGTVYTLEKDGLHFSNMVTLSKGVHRRMEGKTDILPPVAMNRKHVCACSAMDHRKINLPDVYESEEYDFSGAARYDSLNDYRTASMLVIPMEDEKGRVIGVLQLINSMDESGKTIPFDPEYEEIISAMASLAAVSLNNSRLARAVLDILHSFVTVMVDAIDARSSYNANHTKSMVKYAAAFLDWMNQKAAGGQAAGDDAGAAGGATAAGDVAAVPGAAGGATAGDAGFRSFISEEERDPFLMSVWLHDIGKLVIPLEIMDKATRLGPARERILHRIETALLLEEIRGLKHPSEAADAEAQRALYRHAAEVVRQADAVGFLNDGLLAELEKLKDLMLPAAEGAPETAGPAGGPAGAEGAPGAGGPAGVPVAGGSAGAESAPGAGAPGASTSGAGGAAGGRVPLFTPEEWKAVTVRRGTLTAEERREIERHVEYTGSLLSKMVFEGDYEPVPRWASMHHELLDGSGYPDHVSGDKIPPEVRLLTILDVYDALTAEDRPYKPPMPAEKAFAILQDMADHGKLDGALLAEFRESGAWKKRE